jgi:hypothetical protein
MTIKLLIFAVLFIIGVTMAFLEYFKGRKMFSFLGTGIAMIAAFYLFQEVTERFKQPEPSPQPLTTPEPLTTPKPLTPRYIDHGNGTVTDNRTGLIWLKNANCFGKQDWKRAMESAANLASGECGLTDDSKQGMWRLPSKAEWKTMIDKSYVDNKHYRQATISNTAGTGPWKEDAPFLGVLWSSYWTSTTYNYYKDYAWVAFLSNGDMDNNHKLYPYLVWPVREGQ